MNAHTATSEPLLEVTDLKKHFPIRKGLLTRTVAMPSTAYPSALPMARRSVSWAKAAAENRRWAELFCA
jgi:hypothetical protein